MDRLWLTMIIGLTFVAGCKEQPTASSCCSAVECAARGKACDDATCGCGCCTDELCAALGMACDPLACQCYCCTESECEANGEICNASTCQCEPPPCCSAEECAPLGEICNTETCECQWDCEVAAGAPDPCPAGWFCHSTSQQCTESQCGGFFADNCEGELRCVPLKADTNLCLASGSGGDGAECASAAECLNTHVCIDHQCAPAECTVSSVHPCQAIGDHCVGYESLNGPLDLGWCSNDCLAFVEGQCGGGSWCVPQERNESSGQLEGECLPVTGTQELGESCGGAALACRANLVCTSGTCRRICDPAASEGGLGDTCLEYDFCAELGGGAGTLVYGACVPSCDYDLEIPCADGSDCIPQEINGTAHDGCAQTPDIAELATCTDNHSFCAVTSLCDDLSSLSRPPEYTPWPSGLRCYELCRGAAGLIGDDEHPDCSRADAVCWPVYETEDYGVCGP